MKKPISLVAAILITGTGLALWGKPEQKQNQRKAPPPPAKVAPKQAPKQQPAPKKEARKLQSDSPGAPDIALSVNCLQEGAALQGKPLLIEASVCAAREETEIVKVQLLKTGGFWGELFA